MALSNYMLGNQVDLPTLLKLILGVPAMAASQDFGTLESYLGSEEEKEFQRTLQAQQPTIPERIGTTVGNIPAALQQMAKGIQSTGQYGRPEMPSSEPTGLRKAYKDWYDELRMRQVETPLGDFRLGQIIEPPYERLLDIPFYMAPKPSPEAYAEEPYALSAEQKREALQQYGLRPAAAEYYSQIPVYGITSEEQDPLAWRAGGAIYPGPSVTQGPGPSINPLDWYRNWRARKEAGPEMRVVEKIPEAPLPITSWEPGPEGKYEPKEVQKTAPGHPTEQLSESLTMHEMLHASPTLLPRLLQYYFAPRDPELRKEMQERWSQYGGEGYMKRPGTMEEELWAEGKYHPLFYRHIYEPGAETGGKYLQQARTQAGIEPLLDLISNVASAQSETCGPCEPYGDSGKCYQFCSGPGGTWWSECDCGGGYP